MAFYLGRILGATGVFCRDGMLGSIANQLKNKPMYALLLVKSVAPKYKNMPGYYLHLGHWHSAHLDKPIPKGAAIAAHPHAAGVPVPAKHFTDDQWSQLHLPAENVNAPTHNKQLQKLKELSESGDVTGILGSSYGSNTYGVKLTKVANTLLGMHGVPHKVQPGQKAGEHAAVQSSPVVTKDEAISAAIDHLTEDSKQSDMPAGEKAEDAALIAKLKTAQSVKLKQGTIALKSPIPATKSDFGDYKIHHAGIPEGSFIAAKDLTIKDGMVVGVKPALAAKLGLETVGEVQSKTALTQKKETEKAEAVAKEKASVDKQAKLIGGALGLAAAVSSGKMTAAAADEKMKGIKASYDGNLSPDEFQAAKRYSESGYDYSYSYVNEYLRTGVVPKGHDQAKLDKAVSLLDSAISKSSLGSDTTLYRGIHLKELGGDASLSNLDKLVGLTVANKSFLSMTTDKDVSHNYAGKNGVVLVLDAKSGDHALDLSGVAYIDSEKEILLPRNTELKITSTFKKDGVTYVKVSSHDEPAKVDDSPKDGDTKPAADGGMLVFKDGHWHKDMGFSSLPAYAQDLYAAAESSPVVSGNGLIECHVAVADMVSAIVYGEIKVPEDIPVLAYNYDELKGEEFNQNLKKTNPPSVKSEAASFLLEDLLDQSINGHSFMKVGDHFIDPHLKSGGTPQDEIDKIGKYLTKVFAKTGTSPNVVIPKKQQTPVFIGTSKLSQIPWDKQYLPNTNVNAPSHNKAVTKIKAMADAGDVAGLQAFIDSKANAKQNYAKKQGLLAKVALAALTEGDDAPASPAPVAVPAAPAAAPKVKKGKFAEMVAESVGDFKPDIPVFKDYNYSSIGKTWSELLDAGNEQAFLNSVSTLTATVKSKPFMAKNADVQALLKYALDLTNWNNAKKKVSGDVAAVVAAPAAGEPSESDYEMFHNTTEGHNKFWAVAVVGNKVYKKYGAIGTKGQSLIAEFSSPEAAKKAANKDKAVKKGNGYNAMATDDKSQTPLDGWVTSVSTGIVPTGAQVAAFEKLSHNMQSNWLQAAVDKHPLLQNPKWDEDATEEAMDDILSLHQKGVYAHDQSVAATGVPVKPKLLIPSLAGAAGFAEDKMKEGDKVALLKLKQTWSEMPGEQAKMLTAYIGECIDYLGGDKGDAAPVSSAVKPVKPTGLSPSFSGVAGLVEEKIKQGDKPALISLKDLWAHKEGDQTQKIKDYIDAGIASLGGDDSPKEGETKQGANGVTLVFKNGRWHKHGSGDPILDKWAADLAAGKPPTFEDAQHVQSKYFDEGDMDAVVDVLGDSFPDMDSMEDDEGNPLDVLDYATNLHQEALASLGESDAAGDDGEDLDSVTVPDYDALSGGSSLQSDYAAQFLEESEGLLAYAKAHGSAGLAKYVTMNPNGTISVDNQNGFKVSLMDYSDSFADMKLAKYKRLNAMYHFVKKLMELAPDTAAPSIPSMAGWTQTGPQQGSNDGGRFRDENGVEWYCKFPKSEAIAKSEVLAANLYALAGVAGQDAKLVERHGVLAVASRWQSVNKASASVLAATDGTLDGFGADAWLANWDVVGIGNDNLQIGANGKAVRIDAGGALMYRAQGGKKAFGDNVSELDSLRDKAINPHAAAVFGKMSNADITASISKIVGIKNSDIKSLVEKYGPGSVAEKKALYETLVARKNDMLAKYPKAATPPKKRLDPTKLPVKEQYIPKAFDFNTMGAGGSPLSSKPSINAANNEAISLMRQVALAGNLTALKDFKFPVFDKSSGTHTGEYLPIDQHPSKHVIQYHEDLVDVLSEIADPPKPLVMTNMLSAGTIEELNAAFPPKKFGTTVASVKSNEKLGFWLALGGITGDVSKLRPKKISDYSAKSIAAGYQKFKEASKLARHFIERVQYNTTYNYLFRNGKKKDHEGNDLKDVAQAALEHSSTQPEGTSVYRWQHMTDSMVKKILLAADGTVFQANGPMCTSYDPYATQHFGTHRLVIRYAKGARGVDTFGSGGYVTEKEITTLPNARFVILSKNMVNNEKSAGGKRLELELLMLPPDLAL